LVPIYFSIVGATVEASATTEIAYDNPFQTEPHVQEGSESSVSPYLLQPIRSLDEARKEIEAKRSADRDSR
jgi:hypothetical protein